MPNGDTNITVNVLTYCRVKADDMNFGKQPGLNKQLQANANVYVDCSAGTDFDASIDLGLHPSGGIRQMQRQDFSHSVMQTVTGTVPQQQNPPTGTYKDSLTITVTYYNKQQ